MMRRSKLDTNRHISDGKRKELSAVLEPIAITDDKVERIMEVFLQHMQLANSADEATRKRSDMLMMNTFLRELMDGTEQGQYLGLDLGSTNFRVVLVKFNNGKAETTTEYYTMEQELLAGPCAQVFDFIAECIQDFLRKHNLTESEKKIPLGFSFSFPSTQVALNKCILITWTQTFKCPDGPGEDPVHLLEQAILRKTKNLPVDIVVIMSDTVSTLMAGNYLDKTCRIGLILGTGCNAAFVENLSEIEKWSGDYKNPKHVIVNVELGSTGDSGCLDFCRCEFERELDQYSNHPGSFTFEKSFSGMYLGELTRLVLVKLIKKGTLFRGQGGKLLDARWQFFTKDVTAIESDDGEDVSNTMCVLKKFELDTIANTEDTWIFREAVEFVSRRGARIIAAAMATLVNHIGLPEVTIGIDGSVYEKHPKFHDSMMEVLEKFSPNCKIQLLMAKDGSGQGAAFAAVSALRQKEKGIRCS